MNKAINSTSCSTYIWIKNKTKQYSSNNNDNMILGFLFTPAFDSSSNFPVESVRLLAEAVVP